MGMAIYHIYQVPKPSSAVTSCHRQPQCSPDNAHGVKAEELGPSRRHSRVCHLHRGMPAIGPSLFLLGDSAEDTGFCRAGYFRCLAGGRRPPGEARDRPRRRGPKPGGPGPGDQRSRFASFAANNVHRLHPVPPLSSHCHGLHAFSTLYVCPTLEPTLNSETVESPLVRCRHCMYACECAENQIGPGRRHLSNPADRARDLLLPLTRLWNGLDVVLSASTPWLSASNLMKHTQQRTERSQAQRQRGKHFGAV